MKIRVVNVAGARENVGTKDGAYHKEKMLLCKQEEARIQLSAEQADWRDNTDDETVDQELEAHYIYMAQIQEVTPDDADNSRSFFDSEPLQEVQNNNDHYDVFSNNGEHPEKPEFVNDTYPVEQNEHNVIIDSLDMCYDKEQDDQDDNDDLANERDLLASLIAKLKCEIDDSKTRNNLLESSNKLLVDKLTSQIEDFKNKNECLESSNTHFKEANDELKKTNQMMFKDLKKFQDELEKRHDVNYMSKISDMKKELVAHQETISIMSQQKEEQIKFYKTHQSVQTMNMLNRNCKTSFVKPEFFKKAQRANPRLYDIGFYNDNLALMLAPDSDETILRSRMSHTLAKNENSKESFNKHTTLLEIWMDESIPWDEKCKSSKELFKIKSSVDTIFDRVERCKQTIAKRAYFGHIDPFIQNTIEGNFCPQIRKINVDLENFHLCLKEEMVADLRNFNSLENEVDSLKFQMETQKTQFLNEIDRLSREYYYADHMNAILGVYTTLDEFTDLQCDYVDQFVKCERLEKELSKSNSMSKTFEALQQHAINLELDLQHCKEQIKNDKAFKEN
ncbi:hypothetical protein Tco_0975506 [Tanacetum coccineum]|uniref:Uncharacterized protein n=1 Tax=Tanacetum coccineum TaxID=301880 RepID=A0ABQ5EEJ9_9ASTR